MAKRSHPEDFRDLAHIKISPDAKVRGVLVGVCSEMKKAGSCTFWDGELCDKGCSRRVYGYDTSGVRRKLFEHQEAGSTVDLSHCVVKKARCSDELEIFLGSSIVVGVSDDKQDVQAARQSSVKIVQLGDLRLHKSYDICVKVLDLGEEVLVSSGPKKQDLVVADNTGSARFTIWQDTMAKNSSYNVQGAVVREFRGQRFFSTPKKGTTIQKAEDLEDVIKEEVEMPGLEGVKSAKNMHVLLVSSFTKYRGCYKCRSKLEFEDGVGECTKCSAVQDEDAAKLCYMAVMTVTMRRTVAIEWN